MASKSDTLKRDRLVATILRRCKLDKHPSKLGRRDQEMQCLLLDWVSAGWNALPIAREKWEQWWNWHYDNRKDN